MQIEEYNYLQIGDYNFKLPANRNSLTKEQYLFLIDAHLRNKYDVSFRPKLFFQFLLAELKGVRKWRFLWQYEWKRKIWTTKFGQILTKIFTVEIDFIDYDDLAFTIREYTDFLFDNKEEVFVKSYLRELRVRRWKWVRWIKKTVKGPEDFGGNITFEQYKNAIVAYYGYRKDKKVGFDDVLLWLYRDLDKWQIKYISDTEKEGVLVWFADFVEFLHNAYSNIGSAGSGELNLNKVSADMNLWMHYAAGEDVTKYNAVNQQSIMDVYYNWSEQKKKNEELKKQYDTSRHR